MHARLRRGNVWLRATARAEDSKVQRNTAFFSTGAGLAASIGDASLFIASDVSSAPARDLLNLFRESAVGATDRVAVVRALARVVAQHGFESVPGFACVIADHADVHGIVYGALRAAVRTSAGEAILDGSQAVTWADRRFDGTLISFAVGEPIEPGSSWFFAEGIVPASGLLVSSPAEVAPAVPRPDEVAHQHDGERYERPPAPPPLDGVIDLTEPAPAPVTAMRPPPPPPPPGFEAARGATYDSPNRAVGLAESHAVAGMACVNGHLNRPDASQCDWCGAELDRARGTIVGARPSLGTLVFDDGARVDLARPIIVGAAPPTDVVIAGEEAQRVIIDHDLDGVSATQFEVHFESWDVFVIDRSTTGTFLDDSSGRRQRLPRHARVKLRPGSRIVFGEHGVRVDASRGG
jgi:hypothetical protein